MVVVVVGVTTIDIRQGIPCFRQGDGIHLFFRKAQNDSGDHPVCYSIGTGGGTATGAWGSPFTSNVIPNHVPSLPSIPYPSVFHQQVFIYLSLLKRSSKCKRPPSQITRTYRQILQTIKHKRLHNRAKLHKSSTTNWIIVMQKLRKLCGPSSSPLNKQKS
jgi:hypothetical protein